MKINISLSYIFRYDSIFLISRIYYSNSPLYENGYLYKIFGISETNSALQLKSYGVFGSRTFPVEFRFPQVITSMKNGKFLFYPQSIDLRKYKKLSKSFVEEWHYNEGLTRLPINFPVNFTGEEKTLWIYEI